MTKFVGRKSRLDQRERLGAVEASKDQHIRAVGDGAAGAALAAPLLRDDKVRMREGYDTPLLCTRPYSLRAQSSLAT